MTQHFINFDDLSRDELEHIIKRAIELKTLWKQARECPQILSNRTIALLFEKSSTRTRVSFEVAATQFGGSSLFLSFADLQLGRGESAHDTARILSTMVDMVVMRAGSHLLMKEFASVSSVPIVNGLSDVAHPCQLLADILTWYELRGAIDNATVTWVGDGSNVCISWAEAASRFGFSLRISTPPELAPNQQALSRLDADIALVENPAEAVVNADLVVTDTWVSMGQEHEAEDRLRMLEPYRVSTELMQLASNDAIFMHCLPANREREVSSEVIDGAKSVVWQEAENRLHAQKALIEFLL